MNKPLKPLVLLTTLAVIACGPAEIEGENVRFDGSSYFTTSSLRLTPDQCRQLCAEDTTDCAGWTYQRPTEQEILATCDLKEQVTKAVVDPCCVSGKAVQP